MSIDFRLIKSIRFSELFDGRLKKYGISEHVSDRNNDTSRCLTDGRGYLWVYATDDGNLGDLSSHANLGNNSPGILAAIAECFDSLLVSEYHPQYWGFETQEEMDQALARLAEEDRVSTEGMRG